VLLTAVEARLGVGREASTMAVPLLNLVTALLAVAVGGLAARVSLRLAMVTGAALSTAGFLLLALTASYPLYLIAYGLLIGAGMAIGVVLPPTLVTRWFVVNRGRALGIVTTPVVIAATPLVTTWMLKNHGLPLTYGLLAAMSAAVLVVDLFIVDRPPGSEADPAGADAHGAHGAAAAGAGGATMPELLRSVRFWTMSLVFMASAASSIVLTAHMVPMAKIWGYSPTLAATLLSAMSFAGIAGTLLFGWISDRLGGPRTLALLAFDSAILWVLLLVPHRPFAATIGIIALMGLHGAGALPAMSAALSEVFGQQSFSRAYGLANLVNLPVSVVCVPAAAMIYARTGSYAGAMVVVAAFLLTACLAVLAGRRGKLKPAVGEAPDVGQRVA
jgi:MFS family permease